MKHNFKEKYENPESELYSMTVVTDNNSQKYSHELTKPTYHCLALQKRQITRNLFKNLKCISAEFHSILYVLRFRFSTIVFDLLL